MARRLRVSPYGSVAHRTFVTPEISSRKQGQTRNRHGNIALVPRTFAVARSRDPYGRYGGCLSATRGRGVAGQGEVRSITLRVTRVHTPDGDPVTIPNTTLTSEPVSRPYGRGRSRVVEHIGLAYEDDVDEALGHLREAATERDGVLADPSPTAYVDEFGSDAVVVRVHYWIEDPRRRDVFGVSGRRTHGR